ncbi:MAG: LPS assembly lipoprotein LptE [bacterium]|nr:LPS assembly lipoprotein LptE [bacterium]
MKFALLLIVITGCAEYSQISPPVLPQEIRKIAVRPFKNKTPIPAIEDSITLKVIDEFQRAGRYEYVSQIEKSDGYVEGIIKRYILEPIAFDANHFPTQYKLWILIDLKFIQRIEESEKELFHEQNFEAVHIFTSETQPGGMSEWQAREILFDKLARDVYKRVVFGFGAVTGASEKKAPK